MNFLDALKKEFHNFVVIGLSEDDQVEVKVKFVFPRLLERDQYIFLSEDFSTLIEIVDSEASLYDLEIRDKEAKATFASRVPRLPTGICDKDAF